MNIDWQALWKYFGWPVIDAICQIAKWAGCVGGAAAIGYLLVTKIFSKTAQEDAKKNAWIEIAIAVVVIFVLFNLDKFLNIIGINERGPF